MVSIDPWLAGTGFVAAIFALGISVFGLIRRPHLRFPVPPFPHSRAPTSLSFRVPSSGGSGNQEAAQRICAALHAWLAESEDQSDAWASFDQLVRETLTEHFGAARVRCYHVRPGCETLQTISQDLKRQVSEIKYQAPDLESRASNPAGGTPAPRGPDSRDGVLGHVAATGKEFVANDDSHGPLVDDLAARNEQKWAWVWPIRENHTTIGIVAVGSVRDAAVLGGDARHAVSQLVSLCWRHVTCLERLRVVQRTDQASGVLTRNDFFTLAGHALADSYSANEPVVVAVMALEGLRRLDDTGFWQQRDTLVEQLGRLIDRRLRTDDLVGRFADDRFVVLLRRLDSGLGRLIAEKLLGTATDCLQQILCVDPGGTTKPSEVTQQQVRLRMGLAGSGLLQPSLEDLLVAAFFAVERARKENTPLATDLGPEKLPTPVPMEAPGAFSKLGG